ncbi:unnamed protein product, partial [Bubo scandiacus]
MSGGSKMDPPLAKAEPISDGGSASGITYFKSGEKSCCDPVGSPRWSRLLAGPMERGAHAGAGLLAGL